LFKRSRLTGKKLTTVYISHSDPDYYFGLDVIRVAFPDARIVATAQTVAAIRASKDRKLAYWGPILKGNAPKKVVVPESLTGDTIAVDGHRLHIIGLNGPDPDRTFVWIPDLRTVVGGIPVFGNMHVWIADTQSVESRVNWLNILDRIEALKPVAVIPGHYLLYANGEAPTTPDVVAFTRRYLEEFEKAGCQCQGFRRVDSIDEGDVSRHRRGGIASAECQGHQERAEMAAVSGVRSGNKVMGRSVFSVMHRTRANGF
jgi:glyoxylase-like metal-dependent hydrolase (beta-lactamase superfamily II)